MLYIAHDQLQFESEVEFEFVVYAYALSHAYICTKLTYSCSRASYISRYVKLTISEEFMQYACTCAAILMNINIHVSKLYM